jgi:hypothetical protein
MNLSFSVNGRPISDPNHVRAASHSQKERVWNFKTYQNQNFEELAQQRLGSPTLNLAICTKV